jgi:hypothetical protein
MSGLRLSPARLIEAEALRAFRALFCRHGALGRRMNVDGELLSRLSEDDKLRVVPLVFGLMPGAALRRRRSGEFPVKPLIRDHLQGLGVPADEVLIDVLKSVTDQYVDTVVDPATGRRAKRKMRIGDLKAAHFGLYGELLRQQNRRCALCGIQFGGACEPTLDHVVPFRLIGDVPDGANYQLMCNDCNSAKGSFLSSLQSAHAWNWVYEGRDTPPVDRPSGQTRFVVLSRQATCSVAGCGASRVGSQLFVVPANSTGLAVADHLTVRCVAHCSFTQLQREGPG